MVLNRVRLIRVKIVSVNLNLINDTYIHRAKTRNDQPDFERAGS